MRRHLQNCKYQRRGDSSLALSQEQTGQPRTSKRSLSAAGASDGGRHQKRKAGGEGNVHGSYRGLGDKGTRVPAGEGELRGSCCFHPGFGGEEGRGATRSDAVGMIDEGKKVAHRPNVT